MSTQIDERVESIEHLEFEPACDTGFHHGTPPKATHFVEQHGCEGAFSCTDCVTSGRKRFEELVSVFGSAKCSQCGRTFTIFDDCVQVRPL